MNFTSVCLRVGNGKRWRLIIVVYYQWQSPCDNRNEPISYQDFDSHKISIEKVSTNAKIQNTCTITTPKNIYHIVSVSFSPFYVDLMPKTHRCDATQHYFRFDRIRWCYDIASCHVGNEWIMCLNHSINHSNVNSFGYHCLFHFDFHAVSVPRIYFSFYFDDTLCLWVCQISA